MTAIENIRANLIWFGLKNLGPVRGCLEVRQGLCGPRVREAEIERERLSHLCLSTNEVASQLRQPLHPGEVLEHRLHVSTASGSPLGIVGFTGEFHFLQATTLQECLAWIAATDLGRTKLLTDFDLKAATAILEAAIKVAFLGDLMDAYSKNWMRTLQEILVHVSPYADAAGWYRDTLWRVATRTVLGNMHPGFHLWMVEEDQRQQAKTR